MLFLLILIESRIKNIKTYGNLILITFILRNEISCSLDCTYNDRYSHSESALLLKACKTPIICNEVTHKIQYHYTDPSATPIQIQ